MKTILHYRQVSVKTVAVFTFIFLFALYNNLSAQAITEIFTDFDNYYRSGAGAQLNSTKPNKSNNLLAFTFNGVTYTTGVKDSALNANGIIRTQGNYKSLPASSIGGITAAATYILLPAADDGNTGSAILPNPLVKIKDVLTDGLNGLNLGSGVTNLPQSASLTFPVENIDIASISDAKPDIMYTQIAATAIGDAPDTVFFVDNTNTLVGNTKLVQWAGIAIVGSHTCDLYTLNTASCDAATITGINSSAQPKDFRLAAFTLNQFGITSGNAPSVTKLIIKPGGTSDLAFVAYNVDAFTALSTLPVHFNFVEATLENEHVKVEWQTGSETNNDHFIVERSIDGRSYTGITTIQANGNTSQTSDYSFTDINIQAGKIYYRIRQVDIDGRSTLSAVATVFARANKISFLLQPNPASGTVLVKHPLAAGIEKISLVNSIGVTIIEKAVITQSNETSLNLHQLPAGVYQVVWNNNGKRSSKALIIK